MNFNFVVSKFSHKIPNYDSTSNLVGEFHCHSDEGEQPTTDRRAIRILWASSIICLIFIISEIIGGYLAESLAIITDAAHLVGFHFNSLFFPFQN